MEEEREQKQNYLREEILEPGYDPQAFMEFLQSKDENGTNIDIWTLKELKQLVRDFISMTDSQQQQIIEPQQSDNQIQEIGEEDYESKYMNKLNKKYDNDKEDQKIEQQQIVENKSQEKQESEQKIDDQEDKNNSKSQSQGNSNLQSIPANMDNSMNQIKIQPGKKNELKAQIPCIKQNVNILGQTDKVIVEVRNYEKKSGGVFSSAYIVYKIQTYPFKWEVARRYNDFVYLHEILSKLYPALAIPPVPKKTSMRNYQPLFLIKRMSFLEKFLTKIIKSTELRNNKFVLGFLSLSNEKEYKSLMNEKIVKPVKLEKQVSVEGVLNLELDDSLNNYMNKASDFLNNNDLIYKKIRQFSKQLIVDFDALSTTMYNIADCFSQLYQQTNQFNLNISEEKRVPLLNDIYITLNNMKVSWGNAITTQIQIVQENLCNHFKYYHQETRAMKEMLKTREIIFKEYQTNNKRLIEKKEKLYQMQNIVQWDLTQEGKQMEKESLLKNKQMAFDNMLAKETAADLESKMNLAFYTNYTCQEIRRLLSDRIKDYSEHFMNFGKLQTDNITEMHIMWADTLTNLGGIGVGKKVFLMERQNKKVEEVDIIDD